MKHRRSQQNEEESLSTFHPNLSWSHYRTLMRMTDAGARRFYEAEAVRANWSRRDLSLHVAQRR